MTWDTVIHLGLALLATYAILLGCLAVYARRHPEVITLAEAVRLGPDLLRLVRGLTTDKDLPGRTRLLLVVLVVYLVLPIDLEPDVLPVIGYADDVILVALVLRAVVRSAGAAALARHWRGSEGGLRVISALAGVRDATEEHPESRDRNTT